MKQVCVALCMVLLLSACSAFSPEKKGGWVSLFDGKSLEGWVQRGGVARYRVENGQIIGTAVAGTPNTFLCTTRDYSDFVLELEFQVDPGLNSGVQIRSLYTQEPKTITWKGNPVSLPANRVYGLQVEIDPSSRAWSGGVHGEGGGGWFNDLKNNAPARQAFQAEQWNHLRIVCQGTSIKTWLNGVPAADLHDDLALSGFIALQVHSVEKKGEGLEVRFRNIRLKEL